MASRASASPARRSLRVGASIALLLGVAIGGCSASPSETGSDATDDLQAQAVEFSECMRANGVADFPDPTASGDFEYGVSVTVEVWRAALDACHDLQPPGSLSSERTPEEQAAALVFADCIRDNGVPDFPDPVDGQPLVNTYEIPSSDTPDGMAILDAAMATCGDLVADAAGNEP